MAKQLRSPTHKRLTAVLTRARKAAGLTQRELAARLSWPHSAVAKVEGGERRVTVLDLIEIAGALGVDPLDLLRRVLR